MAVFEAEISSKNSLMRLPSSRHGQRSGAEVLLSPPLRWMPSIGIALFLPDIAASYE